MMEKDPGKRYKNCDQLIKALKDIKYDKKESSKSNIVESVLYQYQQRKYFALGSNGQIAFAISSLKQLVKKMTDTFGISHPGKLELQLELHVEKILIISLIRKCISHICCEML